jgi:hypothetical protein
MEEPRMTYEEIVAVLEQHQYSKLVHQTSFERVYDCVCGERFRWSMYAKHSGHAEHLAEKLVQAMENSGEADT